METWRHVDMETWTCRYGHGNMDMETWTWKQGHGDMDMETLTETWHGDMEPQTENRKRPKRKEIFLNPFTVCSSCKRTCPSMREQYVHIYMEIFIHGTRISYTGRLRLRKLLIYFYSFFVCKYKLKFKPFDFSYL